ncbi:HNH endonuclease [Virgibacillus dakarensis]|nr:HNH endonuclease [Virgibacillus dakarensis]
MYVTGTALPAVIPSTWGLKGVKAVSKFKGAGKKSPNVAGSKFPYSKEFIQNKINAAKEKLGKVPWLHREVVSTGFSNHSVYGVKPLSEVKPQWFSVKGEGKGRGNVHHSEIDEVIKNDYDINGNVINRSIVPKGYESVDDFLKVIDDTTIKEHGYDSIEEFKTVVGHVDDYLNASPKNNIINKGLAGGKHVKGVDYDVLGFPIFKGDDVKFSLKLKESLFKATDDTQFKECTIMLKRAIEKGEVSKDLFTAKQLRDIENGEARIKGLTWHHHQVPGKMQLVVSKTHKVNHLGGNKLWGDGIR